MGLDSHNALNIGRYSYKLHKKGTNYVVCACVLFEYLENVIDDICVHVNRDGSC